MDFSGKQFPKEVIIMAVRWYLAYALSYRNIEELIKDWNIGLDHSSVQRWVAEYGSWLQAKVRKYLSRNFKRSWRLDETYIKGFCRKVDTSCNRLINQRFSYVWRRLAAISAALCSHQINLFCDGQHFPVDFTKYTLIFT